MLLNILSLEELEIEAQKIDDFLNITCSEDINECITRGNDISVYMARTSKMLADSKYHQDKAKNESIKKNMIYDISASTMNKLVDSDCMKENYLVNWIERLNVTCKHNLDWLRTVISKEKEELRYQHFNGNN